MFFLLLGNLMDINWFVDLIILMVGIVVGGVSGYVWLGFSKVFMGGFG